MSTDWKEQADELVALLELERKPVVVTFTNSSAGTAEVVIPPFFKHEMDE